ncbi:putative phosphatase regulatory subunit-domain-containing protein [Mycena leptocephala]|nr:putative phosphatase regulatory subunit-domain-containing protein [Mycena leptocephala]
MPYSTPGAGPHFHFYRDENSSDSEDGALNPFHHNAPISSSPRARAASHPVPVLCNNKPLKSSLKSYSSAPHMPSHRLRPRPAFSPGSSSSSLSSSSPKVVHFPAPDAGLEKVTVFRRRARPTKTETETETDRDALLRWGGAVATVSPRSSSPLAPHALGIEWGYVLYTPDVPRTSDPGSMMLLETMWLAGVGAHAPSGFCPWTPPDARLACTQTDADGSLALVGSLLVRNVAFEKHVSIHFTLDDWCTTSDVYARYVDAAVHPPGSPRWDRFTFRIPLADYSKDVDTGGLSARKLILAVHFTTPYVRADGAAPYFWCAAGQGWTGTGAGGAGEWWDNNGGHNYCVGFRWTPWLRSKNTTPNTYARISLTAVGEAADIMAATRGQRVSDNASRQAHRRKGMAF